MEVFLRYVVGWDSAQQRPLVHGGILGIPVDYVGVIEEQKSMALHGHFMLWMLSYSDVINRLLEAQATNSGLYDQLANELSLTIRSMIIAELRLHPCNLTLLLQNLLVSTFTPALNVKVNWVKSLSLI